MGWEQNIVSDYPQPVELPSGIVNWVIPGWMSAANFNRTNIADTLYHTPIFVAKRTTYDRVGIDVSTLVGGAVARLGLYAADAITLLPAALLNDFGTVSVASTGDKEIIITLTLERGYYYLSFVSDGGVQLEALSISDAGGGPAQGWNSTGNIQAPDATVRATSNRASDATGGLVDPAPLTNRSETMTHAPVRLRVTP